MQMDGQSCSIVQRRSFTDTFFITAILTVALLSVGQVVGLVIWRLLPLPADSPVVKTGFLYYVNVGVWLVFVAYMMFTQKNRPILSWLGSRAEGNRLSMFALGLLIGFVLNGFCAVVALLHGDICLRFDGVDLLPTVILFVGVLIQSSAEELACRVFMYQRLRGAYARPAVALVGNPALFAVLHLMNSGVTALSVLNIFLVGLLFSMCVYYFDSFWMVAAIHTSWNFTQNILLGLPNSGNVVPFSIFKLERAADSLAYNVGFGIEGTALACVVLVAACVCVYVVGQRVGRHAAGDAVRISTCESTDGQVAGELADECGQSSSGDEIG